MNLIPYSKQENVLLHYVLLTRSLILHWLFLQNFTQPPKHHFFSVCTIMKKILWNWGTVFE